MTADAGEQLLATPAHAVITGLDYKALVAAKSLAGRYDLSLRSDNWPFYTHQCAASLPVEERSKLLERAEREDLSGREVLMLVKQAKNAAAIGAPLLTSSCEPQDEVWHHLRRSVTCMMREPLRARQVQP
jgi:hypothetical protein